MLKRSAALVAVVALAGAAALACRDTRPATTAPNNDLLGGVTSTVTGTVNGVVTTVTSVDLLTPVVHRLTPLSSDVTWSFTAGSGGGTWRNSATGLTVVVPAGAVSAPTKITVTAKAGDVINYDFQPKGFTFAKPISLQQDLGLTSVATLLSTTPLSGAYYKSDVLQYDPSTGLAHVDELEPTTVDLLKLAVTWKVSHFSGYVVACGRQ